MKVASFSRFRLIGIIFSIIGILIPLQMVRVQTSHAAPGISHEDQLYAVERRTIYPERGNIYDRWGHLLAGNVEVYEVGVELQYVNSPETIAATLASVLDLDYNDVLELAKIPWASGKNEYARLADFVSGEKVDQLRALKEKYAEAQKAARKNETMPNLAGLVFRPHLMRSYPEKSLASNVLGFYKFLDREKGVGFFGIEGNYNSLLAGKVQEIEIPLDPNRVTELPNVPPGASLVLTIDREIQAMAEEVIDHAVEKNGAVSGTLIISDPKTGEVWAMATTPRMDLNQYWEYTEIFGEKNIPFNRAVGATYEPGSVFKVLTMASALDAGVVTPDTPFLDNGVIEVGGTNIYNWDHGAWGPQTMTTCMQHSLNVCLTWVAKQLEPSRFYSYMTAFGMGRKTNIDLAGELNYPMAMPGYANWTPVNLGTNSFGQGLAVNPMQMVMAVSALANDGKMMSPHILKSYIDNGKQYNKESEVTGTPISKEAARSITEMLATSLEEEASTAEVEGYRMAGKTGTAEIAIPGEGYSSSLTNASFVGWGPADDPRFIVYIWLEKPTSAIWGSIVAAPVFSDTVTRLVRLINLPPDDMRRQLEGQ